MEVKVVAQRKGVPREVQSKRSVEQTYEPIYTNRIRGMRCGTSRQWIMKSISIKSTGKNHCTCRRSKLLLASWDPAAAALRYH